MSEKTLLLSNAVVVNPGENPRQRSILIQGSRIRAMGARETLKKDYAIEEELDASGKIAIPGLVDAHMHSFQVAVRGFSGEPLLEWLDRRIFPWESSLSKEQASACASLSYLEMARSGTTACSDFTSVRHTEQAFRAAQAIGIRACIGKTVMDCNAPRGMLSPAGKELAESERLIRKWHGKRGGRLRFMLTPRFSITSSDELFLGCKALSGKYGVMIQTHAAENKGEVKMERKLFGLRSIERFERLGLLGPGLLLVHAVQMGVKDAELLAKTGTRVAHCPGSNRALSSGIMPLRLFLETGVQVGLGSDVGAYPRFSMFEQMKLALLMQKKAGTPVSENKVFELATMGGARCLGLESEIGSLEPGKKADIVLLGMNKNFRPEQAVSRIVRSGDAGCVDTVMVDGRSLVKDKRLVGLDEQEAREKAAEVLGIRTGIKTA